MNNEKPLPIRCVNIDWLEVCAYSDPMFPLSPQLCDKMGYKVVCRDYGTPIYKQMFTCNDIIEVRCDPKSKKSEHGIFNDNMCHLRLTNNACYFPNPVEVLQDFCDDLHISVKAISRIDICNDFVEFDNRTKVENFVSRYIKDEYAKINQINLKLHLKDRWAGKVCNYLSWGSQKSMVSTKLYDKTLELKEQSSKPYIKYLWKACGLPTDFNDRHVWRLEFSVKTACKMWVPLYNDKGQFDGAIPNRLTAFSQKSYVVAAWQSLCHHYFKFVKRETTAKGTLKRKYDCAQLGLFSDGGVQYYQPLNIMPIMHSRERTIKLVLKYLKDMRVQKSEPSDIFSLDSVIDMVTKDRMDEHERARIGILEQSEYL